MRQFISESTGSLTMMQEGRGFEAFYLYDERMRSAVFHCHDFYEFYIHIRGGHFFSLDDELYTLKPNQVFIIPPFSMHGLSSTEEMRNYERAFVNVSLPQLRALGSGQMDLEQHFRLLTEKHQLTFQLEESDAARCVQWIRQLQRDGDSGEPLSRLSNFSLLLNLVTLLCRSAGQSGMVSSKVVSNSIIQNVLSWLNSHYTETIRMEDLARRFSISESYLSHEFLKFTNRSVYDYILYRRVTLAQQMMRGGQTLNDIAFQCGFNDYSNFLRIFHKMTGVSPSVYRKQLSRLNTAVR